MPLNEGRHRRGWLWEHEDVDRDVLRQHVGEVLGECVGTVLGEYICKYIGKAAKCEIVVWNGMEGTSLDPRGS
jgi:hypothetical protein